MTPTVLVVEDSPDLAALVAAMLEGLAEVVVAGDVASALRRLATAPPVAAVLCDLGLPDATGAEAVVAIGTAHPGVPVVVLTGNADAAVTAAAVRAGAVHVLPKSAILDGALVEVLRRVLAGGRPG